MQPKKYSAICGWMGTHSWLKTLRSFWLIVKQKHPVGLVIWLTGTQKRRKGLCDLWLTQTQFKQMKLAWLMDDQDQKATKS